MGEPTDFDCIIIGAGPAGSTALRTLSRSGVKACALDKADFPRVKPCGGAISAKTAHELDFEWEDLIEASPRNVVTEFRDLMPIHRRFERVFSHFVMRDRFDARLLEKAIEAGGTFCANHVVHHLVVEAGHVEVQTDRGTLRASVVIGADGANGCTARAVGLYDRERGMAIDAEIHAPQDVVAEYQHEVYLSFADPPWGYSWVFPKRHSLSAGVGRFLPGRSGLKEALRRLLHARRLSDYPMQVYGHPIPAGGRQRRVSASRILLVGDAAGLIDPFWGEGIANAVISGKIAARHVVKALEHGDFSFDAYDAEINEGIVAELAIAGTEARKFYTFPRLFHQFELGFLGQANTGSETQ